MEWTSLNDLREKFLSFYESKEHLRLPSFSLVPKNDKSLLLINSGMAPMKKYFTGEITPPRKRVTTCQKCIRTPDIERVGKTARHGTYFEMLGNFSFGDYFKKEATAWAWEFLTKVLAIPENLLWVSIYQDDDEAFDVWTKLVGVDPSHIVRLGKEDNFWEHGTGPCGPCSEIYFDRGEKYGCGSPTCGVGCDCDRYVEVWNLVFTQFDSDGNGHYARLDHPNIDTGMGLERLACVMQGVDNLFEVDTVRNIMKHISRIAGVEYGKDAKQDVSLRVITDHIRSTTFMIGDGVLPSNEGRGYVLRRLLRRAARHGRLLGIKGNFLSEVCETVIHENRSAYPELADKQDYIKKVILNEEENFSRTIDTGLSLLSKEIRSMEKHGRKVLSGETAFKLYDTYGFPLDLTMDILEEQGLSADEEGFAVCMKQQKELARQSRTKSDNDAWKSNEITFDDVPATKFTGYEELASEGEIQAIITEGERSGEIVAGQKGILVVNRTPFYAESGGQVGDAGTIACGNTVFQVEDTKKNHDGVYMHSGTLLKGTLSLGDSVALTVNEERRAAIARNHSALHLLQAALREVLGTHVEQAGSYVDEHRGRLDFTHFSAMTQQELSRVEFLVNREILRDDAIRVDMMKIEEARKTGAMALFGEKYGEVVRVVSMGDFSKEFCGGTHLTRTGQAGLFRIVSESSVAAGVRRIECVTGLNVLLLLDEREGALREVAETLKSSVADVNTKAQGLAADLKAAQREIEALNARIAAAQLGDVVAAASEISGLKVASRRMDGMGMDAVRAMGEMLKDKEPAMVAVFAVTGEGKVTFLCVCGKEANARGVKAGDVVRAVAERTGGKGGGRPEMALAGGREVEKTDEALAALDGIVRSILG